MVQSSKNIILLTIDCLRYDYVNPDFTPNIMQLANDGILYTNCWSEYGHTINSFETLFKTEWTKELGKRGYYKIGINYNGWLSKVYGYGKDFHVWHDMTEKEDHKFTDDSAELNGLFIRTKKFEPFFAWIHYMDCHAPYYPHNYIPEMQLVDSGVPILKITPEVVKSIREKYGYAVRYLDSNIGALIDYLKRMGIYDNTMIIISADHGEEFMEHGKFGHDAMRNSEEILHIPLIVKGNGKGTNKHLMFFKDIASIILNGFT